MKQIVCHNLHTIITDDDANYAVKCGWLLCGVEINKFLYLPEQALELPGG
jgi:hypothetical protein